MKRFIVYVLSLSFIFSMLGCTNTKGEKVQEQQEKSEIMTEDGQEQAAQKVTNSDSETEIAASTQKQENTKTKIVEDALGRKVELPAEIERIAPLGNTPRMVSYLNLKDKCVARSGMNPEEVSPLTVYAYANMDTWKDLPAIGTDAYGNVDYYPEQIVASNPQVILCTYPEDMVKDLETKTGIPVISVSSGTVFEEDYEQSLRIIGEACNVKERADEIIDFIHASLEDLSDRTKDIPDAKRPSVLSAAATFKGAHGIEGVKLYDPILNALNTPSVAFDLYQEGEMQFAEVDKEQILLWNPQYIFCDYSGTKLVQQDQKENPDFYTKLQAFNDNQIYQFPSSTNYFSNLEVTLANCYFVGKILYPENFADIDVEQKANEIIKMFLGIDHYMDTFHEIGADYTQVDFD